MTRRNPMDLHPSRTIDRNWMKRKPQPVDFAVKLIEMIRAYPISHPHHGEWVRQLMQIRSVEQLPLDVRQKTAIARQLQAAQKAPAP